jgi:hypothetical protein
MLTANLSDDALKSAKTFILLSLITFYFASLFLSPGPSFSLKFLSLAWCTTVCVRPQQEMKQRGTAIQMQTPRFY